MVQVKSWRHSVAEDVSEPDTMVKHAHNSNSKGPTWPQIHRRNFSDSTDRRLRRPSPDRQQVPSHTCRLHQKLLQLQHCL